MSNEPETPFFRKPVVVSLINYDNVVLAVLVVTSGVQAGSRQSVEVGWLVWSHESSSVLI